jgi:hypothetical protein
LEQSNYLTQSRAPPGLWKTCAYFQGPSILALDWTHEPHPRDFQCKVVTTY